MLAGEGSLSQFKVEKAIGRGHFSVVHRATRTADGRRVALKRIQIFDLLDARARERCLREVELLKSLPPHECIIQYLDAFLEANELYIVFEWAEHGDLRRLLRKALDAQSALPEAQIWRYFTQISGGIAHMHDARMMHRDVKPANIFLAANGAVKLGDLGLGRAFGSQTHGTLARTVCTRRHAPNKTPSLHTSAHAHSRHRYEALSKVGTPLYMSPEVCPRRVRREMGSPIHPHIHPPTPFER